MKSEEKEPNNLVDIWSDNVDIKDLIISMVLCIGLSLAGYLLAFGDIPPLISGLIGGAVGFIISSIIIKPKRKITTKKEEEGDY